MYSKRKVSDVLGIPRTTFRRKFNKLLASGNAFPGWTGTEFTDEFVRWAKSEWLAGENYNDCVSITGVSAADHAGDAKRLWDEIINKQSFAEDRIAKRYSQEVFIDTNKPFAIAQLSDIHLGNEYTDYRAINNDCDIIANTPGMYVGFLGDATDNWIGKLCDIQRKQPIKHSAEYLLCEDIINRLKGKWLYYILGNHGYRTVKAAGVDLVQHMFGDASLLYDSDEVLFTLRSNTAKWKIKARHDWRKRSKNNASFAMEDDLRYGNYDWDIALGGHVHSGTLVRPFACRGKLRHAVMVGCFKSWDRYGVTNNFTPAHNGGSGALIFFPDGRIQFTDDLATAGEYITFLRSKEYKSSKE